MIYLIFALLVLVSEVITSDLNLLDQDYYDLSKAGDIFDQFIMKYGEEYQKEKSDFRFNIFKENLEQINKWNKQSDSAKFGVNQFTDLTSDELNMFMGIRGNSSIGKSEVYKPKGFKGPDSLDYRQNGYVTHVKNQKLCGSCYAFAAIGDIEGQYAKKHGTKAFSLSEQQAVDCDRQSKGCDGGWPHWVFEALRMEGGSMKEEHYPYEEVQKECRTSSDKIAVKVTGGTKLEIKTEQQLKDALINYGPLSLAIFVGNQLFRYRQGILDPTDCDVWGHAVLLVGYGKENGIDYWLIKNSWGTGFGEEGYIRLVMGKRACDIGNYVSHSTVA